MGKRKQALEPLPPASVDCFFEDKSQQLKAHTGQPAVVVA